MYIVCRWSDCRVFVIVKSMLWAVSDKEGGLCAADNQINWIILCISPESTNVENILRKIDYFLWTEIGLVNVFISTRRSSATHTKRERGGRGRGGERKGERNTNIFFRIISAEGVHCFKKFNRNYRPIYAKRAAVILMASYSLADPGMGGPGGRPPHRGLLLFKY